MTSRILKHLLCASLLVTQVHVSSLAEVETPEIDSPQAATIMSSSDTTHSTETTDLSSQPSRALLDRMYERVFPNNVDESSSNKQVDDDEENNDDNNDDEEKGLAYKVKQNSGKIAAASAVGIAGIGLAVNHFSKDNLRQFLVDMLQVSIYQINFLLNLFFSFKE